MSNVFLTVAVLFLTITVILALMLGRFLKGAFQRQRRGLTELAAKVGADDLKAFSAGKPVLRVIESTECVIRYIRGGKNQPAGLSLTFPGILLPKFTVSREGASQRFFKRIGLTEELSTGDGRFDQAFFLVTDETDYFKSFFSEAQRREAVQTIFAADPTVVKLQATSAGLSIVCQVRASFGGTVLPALAPEAVLAAVKNLDQGSRWRSSHYDPLHAGTRPLSGMVPRVVALSVVTGLTLVGGLILIVVGSVSYRLTEYQLLWDYLLYSTVFLASFWLLLYYALRGYSWSHIAFIPMALASLVGIPLASMGTAVFLNGYLDNSPALVRQVTLIEKHTSRSKNSTNYHIRFTGWKADQPELHFSVSRSFYNDLSVGDSLEVQTHKGYFNHEWVESIREAQGKGLRPE